VLAEPSRRLDQQHQQHAQQQASRHTAAAAGSTPHNRRNARLLFESKQYTAMTGLQTML
jgi:hypothetical protein